MSSAIVVSAKPAARRRAEKAAETYFLAEAKRSPLKRQQARLDRCLTSIRAHRQPMTEAKRLARVEFTRVGQPKVPETPLDFSDVQELRVKLIRRDGYLSQEMDRALTGLDREIALGAIGWTEFTERAHAISTMGHSLSPAVRRRLAVGALTGGDPRLLESPQERQEREEREARERGETWEPAPEDDDSDDEGGCSGAAPAVEPVSLAACAAARPEGCA